jgi:hypothetical protein
VLRPKLTHVRLIIFLSAIVIVAAGCGGSDDESAGGSGSLATITSVQQVARAFNEDTGHPRLVLLLSPT